MQQQTYIPIRTPEAPKSRTRYDMANKVWRYRYRTYIVCRQIVGKPFALQRSYLTQQSNGLLIWHCFVLGLAFVRRCINAFYNIMDKYLLRIHINVVQMYIECLFINDNLLKMQYITSFYFQDTTHTLHSRLRIAAIFVWQTHLSRQQPTSAILQNGGLLISPVLTSVL